MITVIDFSYGGEDYKADLIASVIRGTVDLYPVFDDCRFTYVLRHILTGFIFCEAGNRDVALKDLRDLYAIHSWYVFDRQKFPAYLIAKGLDIRREAYNSLPFDPDKTFVEIALRVVHRPMGRGKFVPDNLRVQLNDEYLTTVF